MREWEEYRTKIGKFSQKIIKHFLAATCVFFLSLFFWAAWTPGEELDRFQFYLWCSALLPGCLTAQLIGPSGAVLCRNYSVFYYYNNITEEEEENFFKSAAQGSRALKGETGHPNDKTWIKSGFGQSQWRHCRVRHFYHWAVCTTHCPAFASPIPISFSFNERIVFPLH